LEDTLLRYQTDVNVLKEQHRLENELRLDTQQAKSKLEQQIIMLTEQFNSDLKSKQREMGMYFNLKYPNFARYTGKRAQE
jgi:glycerophosphoryl diester phosphodiesterase